MDVWQAWLVLGIPSLLLGLALFLGRSRTRAFAGYAILLAGFAGMAAVDRASAAVFGIAIPLVYAAGRGGQAEGHRVMTDVVGVPDAARPPHKRSRFLAPRV